MDTLTITKNEIVIFLQEHKFDHLSRNEQVRLREYLEHMLTNLQDAANLQRIRRAEAKIS